MKKSVIISSIVGVVVLAIVAGVWWLFSSNRLVYVADPETGIAAPAPVCDKEYVDRYNLASYIQVREGYDEPSVDTNELSNLEGDIKGLGGYEKDATCQTILFWVAYFNSDNEAATVSYDALLDLHEQNKFADSNLNSASTLASMGDLIAPATDDEFEEGE